MHFNKSRDFLMKFNSLCLTPNLCYFWKKKSVFDMHLLSTQCYVIKYTKLVAVYYHQLTLFFVLPREEVYFGSSFITYCTFRSKEWLSQNNFLVLMCVQIFPSSKSVGDYDLSLFQMYLSRTSEWDRHRAQNFPN